VNLLEQTVARIVPQDTTFRDKARSRLDQLTMPHWALGRLMDLALDLAGITRSLRPPVERRVIFTMAADHGVAAEGVSKYPQEVTHQMVLNFLSGGAGINALSGVGKAEVRVVNMGVAADLSDQIGREGFIHQPVASGTANIAAGPAMSREQAVRSLETGISIALDHGASFDVLGTGEMGIANTTPSSAIVACITGTEPSQVTGRGTGLEDDQFQQKISIIEKILRVNQPDPTDPVGLLAKIGGFEIGGLAGLILGAASVRKPVLLDGFITTAAGLIACGICPAAADYLIAAHRSVEQGHRVALAHLNKQPLLDLDLRLGEGTGAALAMTLVEAAMRILTEVATFEEAAVSHADK
jgi:nicotinate-nucleotide--dimethylbenzimidazole phosphoribosyltransferase